ncbi:murein biosynthesis integral membrane protein MurJ [Mycobacterium sp. TJFP1]|uniref:murein biosynthesis integral membrane protein MurJ n=1 Tax=Mycolicibacterium vanbaalenii TaxID=110539 RepID=UPI0035690987
MTDERSSAGIGRTSLAASAGTLGSRVLGFGRNLALAAAVGTGLVADAYNIANQVPNQVFLLLGGGTIAFIFVPQLMRHSRSPESRADEYGSLLIFAGAAFGLLVTSLLLVLGPAVIELMGGSSWGDAQLSLSSQLFVWCIPQIFFYTLFGVTSQIMNARGKFSSAAWAPAINSVVIIIACIPIVIAGSVQANSPGSVSPQIVTLLGASTLLGSALQSMLLFILLKRVGFRLRVRFSIRGLGLRTTAVTGFLTLTTAGVFQLAVIVTAALSTQAGSSAEAIGYDGRGYTAFFYAQTLLLITQGVASAGLANVLLVRLSSHYANGNRGEASVELNEAILAIGALLIPVMSIFMCLGPLGTEVLFARGETSQTAAHFIGVVLAVLAAGLVPYALHDVLIRPFFAMHEAKIPLRSAVVVGTIWILGSFAASSWLPKEKVLLGIAAAFSISYLIDLPIKLRSLRTRAGFKVSDVVVRGYLMSLAAGALTATVIGFSVFYLRPLVAETSLARALLLFGATASFALLYYALTFRSPASLGRLFRWFRK